MENNPKPSAKYIGIFTKTSVANIFRLLIDLGTRIIDADEGSLLVLVEATDELEFVMTTGLESSEEVLMGQRVPLGKGITGLAALSQEVQIGPTEYGNIKQSTERGKDPKAVIAAPMLIGDELLGVITAVSFREGKQFTSRDAKIYAGFASIAAVVVEQQRAIESCITGTQALEATNGGKGLEDSIIQALTRIVQTKPHALEPLPNSSQP